MKKILLAAALTIGFATTALALDKIPATLLQKVEEEVANTQTHLKQPRMWKIYHDGLWVHVAPFFREKFSTHFTTEHLAKTLFHIRAYADDQCNSIDFFRGLETWSEMKPEIKH